MMTADEAYHLWLARPAKYAAQESMQAASKVMNDKSQSHPQGELPGR